MAAPSGFWMHFNPRPPRGGRLPGPNGFLVALIISIHAPREGGDFVFQPSKLGMGISIHAPREGGDYENLQVYLYEPYISIHAPREGGDLP